ncbi:uncharacterized protein LOC124154065 [Ischnura elegans]|uniref:uncharacterized protein LOC124154065 n=1 Tax=Ischnura elegans TaxID=197161 RepID=UPI001ED87432|nr:uncharacterized protein LOC124154065 [Ischnura elegans]
MENLTDEKMIGKEKEPQNSETSEPKKERRKLPECMHVNKNLVMLKITQFVLYGAIASLLPYLTIHMQSIGLTVEEIAVIYLALPFTTFISPPLTGFLVDRFGKYKPVVVVALVLTAAFHHALLLIPPMELPGSVPPAYVARHPVSGGVEVWWSPCPSRECPDLPELELVLTECTDYCSLQPPIEPGALPTLPPELFDLVTGSQDMPFSFKIANPSTPLPDEAVVGEEAEDYVSRANTISENVVSVSGEDVENETSTTLWQDYGSGGTESWEPYQSTENSATLNETFVGVQNTSEDNVIEKTGPIKFKLEMHPDLAEPIENLGIELDTDSEEEEEELEKALEEGSLEDQLGDVGSGSDKGSSRFNGRFVDKLLEGLGINSTILDEEDLRCGGIVMSSNATKEFLRRMVPSPDQKWCILQKCSFRAGGPEVCPPDYIESDDRIFWIYFTLRFLGTMAMSAGVTMLDPIALTMIQKYGGEFGRERMFSTFGMALFSPITGLLIDQSSRKLGYTDYSAAFYSHDVLLAISAIAVMLMPIGTKLPAEHIMRDLMRLVRLPYIIIFIFFLFILGNFWGFIESFLFLYLKELGAPNYLLGLTLTVGTLSSMPFLYGAENITRYFGHVNIIIIAFFSHAARLMGYSFIDNAWWCFPFEAIEALAVHLMWVAAATYCATICPKNLLATLIGVLGMAHFSLGRGSGSFVGGFLLGSVGTRQSFRIMGYLAAAGGVLYGLLHYFWLKKLETPPDMDKDGGDTGEEVPEGKDPELANLHPEKVVTPALERLSLMIQVTQRGSLTDIPHYTKGSNDSGLNGSSILGHHKKGFLMRDFNQPRNSIATATIPYSGTGTPTNNRRPYKGGSPFGSQHLLQRTSSVGSPAGRIWIKGKQPASPKGISKLALEDGKSRESKSEEKIKEEGQSQNKRPDPGKSAGENGIKQPEKELTSETDEENIGASEVVPQGHEGGSEKGLIAKK